MTTTTETRAKVRTTVDMAPEMHHELRAWCLNSGLPAAKLAGVLRALTDRLLRDPDLSAAIKHDLQART